MRYCVGLVAALFLAGPAVAEDWDFVLVNDTGSPIALIELAPAGTHDWQPALDDDGARREAIIGPGGRTTVRFDRSPSHCRYDLQVTVEDGSTQVFPGANVCDNGFITLGLSGGQPSISER